MSTAEPVDFDAFAAACMPRLRRFALASCRDPHRADDLVQSALERVYAAWPRAGRSTDPYAYARTTLIRVLISEERRPWRRREVSTDQLPHPAEPEPDAARRLDVLALVRRLPARQRLVLLLRFVEDLPVAEVARLMGCSDGTVKSQTSAAAATLRRWAQEHPDTAGARR